MYLFDVLKDNYPVIGLSLALFLGLTLLILVRRRTTRSRLAPAPRDGGMALAMVLDEDLGEARRILEEKTKLSGPGFADAVIGLVAVLRAQGELQRARTLLDQLAEKKGAAWVDALRVRLALDADDLPAASELMEEAPDLPVPLAVATLVRHGKWADAFELYRKRTARKARSSEMEANLMAGMAVEAFQEGRIRPGQKLLKKACGHYDGALLPLIVGSMYHQRENERQALGETLAKRWPWRIKTDVETFDFISTSHVVEEARSAWDAGEAEVALGILRDHLDAQDDDWLAREQYVRWILELEDPRGWRAELADLVERLKNRPDLTITGYCQSCGLTVEQPTVVCPRCDAIGSFGRDVVSEVLRARYLDNPSGVGLDTLIDGVQIERVRGGSS